MEEKFASVLKTPIGDVIVLADHASVLEVTFSTLNIAGLKENSVTQLALKELRAYFYDGQKGFTVPIKLHGTDFQKDVWARLVHIPYGETISYTYFSRHHPLAIRAIASANGKNKLAIIIPCHRVIGKNGKLVGYSGELWRKQWLLQHEREILNEGQTELKF